MSTSKYYVLSSGVCSNSRAYIKDIGKGMIEESFPGIQNVSNKVSRLLIVLKYPIVVNFIQPTGTIKKGVGAKNQR